MNEQIRITKQFFPADTHSAQLCTDGFALLIQLSGSAVIRTGAAEFSVQEGEALLLRKEPDYFLDCTQACSFIRIDFSEEAFLQSCLPVLKGCPMLVRFFIQNRDEISMSYLLFKKGREDFSPLAEKLLKEYENQNHYYESVLLCELMTLLLSLSRNCWTEASMSNTMDSKLLQEMLEYLVNHSTNITLQSMADAFNYHPNSVSTILKRGTGKHFQQLLEQTRMSHVSEMLGHMTVQEAAENCGYKNMSNFYIRFQKYFGMTPGEYSRNRQQMQLSEERS